MELFPAFRVFMGVKIEVGSVVRFQYLKDPTKAFEAIPLIHLFHDPVISMSHGSLPVPSFAFPLMLRP